MRVIQLLSFFVIVLFLFESCTERIDLKLNDGDNLKLVVDAWITNEAGPHKVTLSRTTSYFENEAAPRVSGADVRIEQGNETIILEESEKGEYLTPVEFQGEVGKTYQLKIEVEGELYESSATLSRLPKIDSLGYQYSVDEASYSVLLYTKELPGIGDFYLFRSYKNGSLTADTLRNSDFVSDEFVDGSDIPGVEVGYEDLQTGDVAILEMLSISKEAHDFFLAVMLETDYRGGPFDTPPANIPSNISNGAFGFFNASAIERDSILIVD